MEIKRYKAILNIGYIDEKAIFFDRLTSKKVQNLMQEKNYILLFYSDFMQKYMVFDKSSKITEYQTMLFNSNLSYYCGL